MHREPPWAPCAQGPAFHILRGLPRLSRGSSPRRAAGASRAAGVAAAPQGVAPSAVPLPVLRQPTASAAAAPGAAFAGRWTGQSGHGWCFPEGCRQGRGGAGQASGRTSEAGRAPVPSAARPRRLITCCLPLIAHSAAASTCRSSGATLRRAGGARGKETGAQHRGTTTLVKLLRRTHHAWHVVWPVLAWRVFDGLQHAVCVCGWWWWWVGGWVGGGAGRGDADRGSGGARGWVHHGTTGMHTLITRPPGVSPAAQDRSLPGKLAGPLGRPPAATLSMDVV